MNVVAELIAKIINGARSAGLVVKIGDNNGGQGHFAILCRGCPSLLSTHKVDAAENVRFKMGDQTSTIVGARYRPWRWGERRPNMLFSNSTYFTSLYLVKNAPHFTISIEYYGYLKYYYSLLKAVRPDGFPKILAFLGSMCPHSGHLVRESP